MAEKGHASENAFGKIRIIIHALIFVAIALTGSAFFADTLFKGILATYLSVVATTFWIVAVVIILKSKSLATYLYCAITGIVLCIILWVGEINSYYDLSDAVGRGDIHRIKKLVSKGYDVNTNTNSLLNMLTWAFWYPYPNKTIWSDSRILKLTNEERENKILEILEILIDNGADINVLDPQGNAPIHCAVSKGQTKIVKMLIAQGADINLKRGDGNSPLNTAARAAMYPDSSEMVKILIANGADVNVKGRYHNTPLHNSVYSGNLEIVQALIKSGADVNAKNKDGKTPRKLALENETEEVVELLSRYGAKE